MVNYPDTIKAKYEGLMESAENIRDIQRLAFTPAFKEVTSDIIANPKSSEEILEAEKLRGELHAVANLGIAALMNEAMAIQEQIGNETQQPLKYNLTYVFEDLSLKDQESVQKFGKSGRDLVEISMSLGGKEIELTIPAALLKNHQELYDKAVAGELNTSTLADHKEKVNAYLASPEGMERTAQLADMSLDDIKKEQAKLEESLVKGNGILVGQDAVVDAAHNLNPRYFKPEALGKHFQNEIGEIQNQEHAATVNILRAMQEKTYPAQNNSVSTYHNEEAETALRAEYDFRTPKLKPKADIEHVEPNPQDLATASVSPALERPVAQAR